MWDSIAKSSISSRVTPHFSAIISAPRNWLTSCVPYRLTQPSEVENGSVKPNCSATSIAEEIGIMLMFCTPPAMITSFVPLMTACAAKCTACWLEPHCRSIVVPGISSGRPAASQAVRAMSPACGPIASTQPKNTSSTAIGSRSLRSTIVLMTCAPRSAGCTWLKPPPRLPTGVRAASTM